MGIEKHNKKSQPTPNSGAAALGVRLSRGLDAV
jgi:hypothetical protein